MAKAVLILSGGMDSTVLLAKLKREGCDISTLTFNYGSKHNRRENMAAAEIAKLYGVENRLIKLAFVNELFKSDLLESGGAVPEGHYEDASMRRTVVPFRNGIMLSIATGFAESINADIVYYGAHAGDHAIYPDCRSVFVAAMAEAMRLGTYANVALESPFANMTKRDIGLLGKELGVPFEVTWTCYVGCEKHCGRCGACTERREALVGFDPTIYE